VYRENENAEVEPSEQGAGLAVERVKCIEVRRQYTSSHRRCRRRPPSTPPEAAVHSDLSSADISPRRR